jgi:hypothetical protein
MFTVTQCGPTFDSVLVIAATVALALLVSPRFLDFLRST